MSDVSIPPAAAEFVERMGILWEGQGLPRIAGRILGYFSLQPEPRSLDDIAAALGVSKASVSNDARLLERLGYVTLSSRASDRRDYYAIAPDMPLRILARKLDELERLQDAIETARRLPDIHPAVEERLRAFGAFYDRAARLLRDLLGFRDATRARLRPVSHRY